MPDLTQFAWVLWLALILVFVVIEMLTVDFTFLMLALGSFGGLVAFWFGGEWWLQIIVAAVLSVLFLFTIRPPLLRLLHRGEDPARSNVDALQGLAGRVLGELGASGGLVKLANGETWTARMAADPVVDLDRPLQPAAQFGRQADVLDDGTAIIVVAIEGSTAVVAPAP